MMQHYHAQPGLIQMTSSDSQAHVHALLVPDVGMTPPKYTSVFTSDSFHVNLMFEKGLIDIYVTHISTFLNVCFLPGQAGLTDSTAAGSADSLLSESHSGSHRSSTQKPQSWNSISPLMKSISASMVQTAAIQSTAHCF